MPSVAPSPVLHAEEHHRKLTYATPSFQTSLNLEKLRFSPSLMDLWSRHANHDKASLPAPGDSSAIPGLLTHGLGLRR